MSPRARRGFFFQKTGTCPAARYSSGKSIFQRVCVDRDLHHGGNWFKTRQSNRQVTFSVYAKPCVFATTSRNPSNESMSGLGFQNAFKQWCMQQFVLQALIVRRRRCVARCFSDKRTQLNFNAAISTLTIRCFFTKL